MSYLPNFGRRLALVLRGSGASCVRAPPAECLARARFFRCVNHEAFLPVSVCVRSGKAARTATPALNACWCLLHVTFVVVWRSSTEAKAPDGEGEAGAKGGEGPKKPVEAAAFEQIMCS